MGCQNSKVRDARRTSTPTATLNASTEERKDNGGMFGAVMSFYESAEPFHSPPRRRRRSGADDDDTVTTINKATPSAAAINSSKRLCVVSPTRADSSWRTATTPVAAVAGGTPVAEDGEKSVPQEASEVAFTAPLFFPVEEEEEVAPIVTDVAVATEAEEKEVEVLPLPLEEDAIAEQQQQQQEEETEMTVPLPVVAEQEEAIAAPVAVMGERTTNATAAPKPRRVAFDKETMRRTAPNTKPSMHNSKPFVHGSITNTHSLTKKQQQMMQSGRKSAGRRGPVASKHSRCKAQMQSDVYLDMANAFERLLTNVNTIDAHLDSR